jgi:hypothetical protein
MVGSVKVL